VEFAGPTKINSENYFYLPTGNTEVEVEVVVFLVVDKDPGAALIILII
jgi:hypothetical protein